MLRNRQAVYRWWELRIQQHPRLVLAFLLAGNNLANIALILVGYRLWAHLAKLTANPDVVLWLGNLLGTTSWILLMGEILPKAFAVRHPLSWLQFVVLPLTGLWWLLYPVSWLLNHAFSLIERRIYLPRKTLLAWVDQVLRRVADGEALQADELRVLRSILRIEEKIVKMIMRPRTEMVALSTTLSVPELVEALKQIRASHVPVYTRNLDTITGILHVKRFLLAYLEKPELRDWHQFLRKPLFVPEYMRVVQFFDYLRQKKEVLAIVVDEYGGVSGMVSLEDLLEEILGEIYSEFDRELPEIEVRGEGRLSVRGSVSLSALAEKLNLPQDYFADLQGVDTVAGLILHFTHFVPPAGTRLRYKDLQFLVEHRTSQRILRVGVEYIKKSPESNQESS